MDSFMNDAGKNENIGAPRVFRYDRERAEKYARRWAFDRNPLFYDFTGGGGNCTNFVSQCLLAGTCQMNFTDIFGWYYLSVDDRAAAWTGVEFFYNFITGNNLTPIGDGSGPFGEETDGTRLEVGDVIQLGHMEGDFYHTLFVSGKDRRGYLVAAHSDDALDRPLYTYNYRRVRYLHILGYRARADKREDCFERLINGGETE